MTAGQFHAVFESPEEAHPTPPRSPTSGTGRYGVGSSRPYRVRGLAGLALEAQPGDGHDWEQLRAGLGPDVSLNGHPERRLPNTLNVNFAGHSGAELLARVPGIAASTGSACHEGEVRPSPVLEAMGVDEKLARGAVRLSVGRFTTEAEVDRAAKLLGDAAL